MRQMGEVMNPRDERGWMVPRHATKRRQVYDMLVAGRRPFEIMYVLELSRPAFNNHRHFITSWGKANASAYATKHR